MRIPTDEYEQRRHVFDMCRWINQTLIKMESESDFDRSYFERISLTISLLKLRQSRALSWIAGIFINWSITTLCCLSKALMSDASVTSTTLKKSAKSIRYAFIFHDTGTYMS